LPLPPVIKEKSNPFLRPAVEAYFLIGERLFHLVNIIFDLAKELFFIIY
jgi:hypothetical protein